MTLPNPPGDQDVAPGQTISSEWGNAVWDHSVRVFDDAPDRDAQVPAPHEGAVTHLVVPRLTDLFASGAQRAVAVGNAHAFHVGTFAPPIIAGSGSQCVILMAGWAATPLIVVTLGSQFAWNLRLGAVTPTQVNLFCTNGDGELPADTRIPLNLYAFGEPAPNSWPSIAPAVAGDRVSLLPAPDYGADPPVPWDMYAPSYAGEVTL